MSNSITPNFERLAQQLNYVEQTTMAKVGEQDAKYIRNVIIGSAFLNGRAFFLVGFITLGMGSGCAALAVGKILDNMEIGHNVMHGQYD